MDPTEVRYMLSMNMSSLKSIFLPCGEANPYQKLLVKHLTNLGVQVEGTNRFTTFLSILATLWRPDILHLHWLDSFFHASNRLKSLIRLATFISGLSILRLTGVKIVWTVHNLKNHENTQPKLDRICTTFVVKSAHAIIAHSQTARLKIIKMFRLKNDNKIFLVPPGNYIDYYKNNISRRDARKALGIAERCFLFLYLGCIRPYKGIIKLTEGFKKLGCDEAQLIIAGKPLDEKLARLIRQKIAEWDNIKFIPAFIADDQIQVYMNACDVVVLPYRDVLTSSSIFLAISFGRACIVPHMGCIGDVLDNSGAFLYDPSDKEGLPQAMNHAIERKDDLLDMGEHNRRLAEKYDWNRIAETTLDVYRRCLR